jgi:hypothetical protein
MPFALSDRQMSQIATMANRVPQHLRSAFLKRLASLLARARARRGGIDFLDADVWRALSRRSVTHLAATGCSVM